MKQTNNIEDTQEFQVYLMHDGEVSTEDHLLSKATVLLSQIERIEPVVESDRSYHDVVETWVHMKSGKQLAVIADYEDVRKVWVKFIKNEK